MTPRGKAGHALLGVPKCLQLSIRASWSPAWYLPTEAFGLLQASDHGSLRP